MCDISICELCYGKYSNKVIYVWFYFFDRVFIVIFLVYLFIESVYVYFEIFIRYKFEELCFI